jgi:TRAP-type C4-dicarboxylate transport system permease small subunit
MNDAVRRSGAGRGLMQVAVAMAYAGGAVVAVIGLMSAVSIVGRTVIGRPIIGDFELVEIGTAIAGSLFLPYCQATHGHIIVDFFTLRAGVRVRVWLDRFGCLLMAMMFLAVGWRTIFGASSLFGTGETSMLMGVPIWIGYAGMVPGILTAGLVALAQAAGVPIGEPSAHE